MKALKHHFSQNAYIASFFVGLVFLAASLIVQFYASNYATRASSDSVTDIILSNTRVYDVSFLFVYGSVFLVALAIYLALRNPHWMPFSLKSVAVFTFIRAIFVSLTHISPFPSHASITSAFFTSEAFNGIFTGKDLFFSGHTGLPFLFALILWDINRPLGYLFLGFSIMFAFVVLLGHLHYTIDVLSAYFITYTIFHICKFLFKKDWLMFQAK